MFSALRKLPSVVRTNAIQQKRNLYVYVGRPRQPLSIAESWCHAITIIGGIVAVPIYVITHICEYRGIEKAGKVGPIKKRQEWAEYLAL